MRNSVRLLARRWVLVAAASALLFGSLAPAAPVAEAQSGRKLPEKARKPDPSKPGDPQQPQTNEPTPPPLTAKDLEDAVQLDVNVVNVEAVVVNSKTKEILQGLTEKNFAIFEDGVKQEVTNFTPSQGPMTVVVLIEFSRLIHNRYINKAEVLRPLYVLTRSFVKPEDNVAIVAFDTRPEVVTDFTGDTKLLNAGLDFLIRNTPAFSESNVYDALAFVLQGGKADTNDLRKGTSEQDVEFGGLKQVEGRTAVIMVTLGRDTFSKLNYDKIRKVISDVGVPIYTIGVGNLFYKIYEARLSPEENLTWLQSFNTLRTFSRMSGGVYFPVTFAGEVPTVVESITNLMRSQYSLGYTPSNTRREGKTRKIEVLVDIDGDGKYGDKGFEVQHRESYVEPLGPKP